MQLMLHISIVSDSNISQVSKILFSFEIHINIISETLNTYTLADRKVVYMNLFWACLYLDLNCVYGGTDNLPQLVAKPLIIIILPNMLNYCLYSKILLYLNLREIVR